MSMRGRGIIEAMEICTRVVCAKKKKISIKKKSSKQMIDISWVIQQQDFLAEMFSKKGVNSHLNKAVHKEETNLTHTAHHTHAPH